MVKGQVLELSDSPRWSLFQFAWHDVTTSITTPPKIVQCKVTPPFSISSGFPDNLPLSIYIPEWREAKCFIQKHNTMTLQSLKPRPLNLESSPLAIRSWTVLTNTWLPYSVFIKSIFHRSMITLICQSTFPCKPFQQHNSILDPMNQWQSPQN